MRYFDTTLLANSAIHQGWFRELNMDREFFRQSEEMLGNFARQFGLIGNASAILPREAWMELDTVTRRVLRDDGGEPFMTDLMALAKPINIGKLVHMTRVSSDANNPVNRSMSGQVPNAMDKVVYDYRGAPVPIFSTAYGREWREWNTFASEGFAPLVDDQEAATDKLNRDMANYALDGDASIVVGGYQAYGLRNSPFTKVINLGSGAGGANIDLTTANVDALDTFFSTTFGAMLDSQFITDKVNVYISAEIARNFDKQWSDRNGTKQGTIWDFLSKNRRINKFAVTRKLVGNQFFGFVPRAEFIRPLIGMAVNTTAKVRQNPTDNYQFLVMGAMGLEIRGDFNGLSGVFVSTVVN